VRRLAFVLLVVAATAGPADGAIVTREDVAGRMITFDVPAGVDVNPYASVLRRALHGDEIESLTIRFVSRATLTRSCGGGGVSCYRGRWRCGEIFLPARGGSSTKYSLLHEYAHHLDAGYGLTSSRRWEPAARRWWAARRIDRRLKNGQVTWDYELGWDRSIAEIFAEDYVQLYARPRYGISWLSRPNGAIRTAIRRDLRDALTERA
jgi:hypothetical protein